VANKVKAKPKPTRTTEKRPAKSAAARPSAKSSKKATKPVGKKKETVKPSKAAPAKSAKPAPAKPAAKPQPAVKPPSPVKPGKAAAPAATDPKKKGITVSEAKPAPVKKPRPGAVPIPLPPGVGRLLDPKSPIRKPLIPSGPKAAHVRPLGAQGEAEALDLPQAKTPFNAEQLEEFRQLLIKKRAQLVGDISTMETEALRGGSGNLSNMPSHLAEQGSEAYDQSLSLDLAAADRKLLREIDDALKRIAEGTYGVCEATGKPIKVERLRELPWARYSIEAAREIERQSMRPM